MASDQLEELEGQIFRLIEKHEKIKREKQSAEKQLQQRGGEWHQLAGRIRQYERERSEVRERIAKILGRFERLNIP